MVSYVDVHAQGNPATIAKQGREQKEVIPRRNGDQERNQKGPNLWRDKDKP